MSSWWSRVGHALRPGFINLRIYLLAFLILLLILIAVFTTQYSTGSTIGNLQASSYRALSTFRSGNTLEELVNQFYSVDLDVRKLAAREKINATPEQLKRDLNGLLQKLDGWVTNEMRDAGISSHYRFDSLLRRHTAILLEAIQAIRQGKPGSPAIKALESFTDSDEVYQAAVQTKIELENSLQQAIGQYSALTERITLLSRILSITSIAGVALLGTVLLRRLHLNNVLMHELDHARAEAEEMARRQDHFVANISHEIRTPVNAISGFAQLLSQTPLTASQQQFADIIRASSRLLLSLVNDLLDAARLKANQLQLRPRVFAFPETCDYLEAGFRRMAAEKGIALDFTYDPSIPAWLYGDADRLQQVLGNLVSNAIRYTNEGKVGVHFTLHQADQEKVVLQLAVEDTGIGIDEADRERIFERFEQAEVPEQDVAGGTGLGLNIVKTLVELQGGSIRLESKKGIGSTFILQMPYLLASPGQAPGKTELPGDELIAQYPSARVLIAEDNSVNQLLLRHLLARHGIAPVIVSTGKEALDFLEINPECQLVLMDIQMPGLTGDEAARQIRESLHLTMPIVAITAYAREVLDKKAGTWIPDDYLMKPMENTEVERVLQKYLPPEAALEATPIDHEWLTMNYHADQAFIQQLINMYLEQLPDEIAALAQAIEKKDAEQVAGLCHHLSSTVSSVSPHTSLRYLLQALGRECREDPPHWPSIGITSQVVQQQLQRCLAEAQGWVARQKIVELSQFI